MSRNNEQAAPSKISKQMEKIKGLYFSCLVCRKELDPKRIRQINSRCKKCEREYAKVWPSDYKEFYDMFKGQC